MVWKKIEGYDYDYRVNAVGDVANFALGSRLKWHDNGNGYMTVQLKQNHKSVNRYVHRLVAEAFIPNPHNLRQVNHVNQNKHDNSVENLEWCTAKENSHHSKSWEYAVNATKKRVVMVDETGQLLCEFPSARECANQLGISESQISRCCRGALNQTHGFIFKYVTEGANEELS